MQTKPIIKHVLLVLTLALGIVSCKKDKSDSTPPPPAEVKAISFTDLKALSTPGTVNIPDAKKITGVVISDVSNTNIDSKTVVLQDTSSQVGIILTFDAVQAFALGDLLEVNISKQTLAQVNGEIEILNIPAANAKKTGTGTITAKATTIAEINTNKTAWDGTLVTIAATELSGGNGKYTGTLTVKDASGVTTTNVLAGAAFENTAYPVSVIAITGIVRLSEATARIDIRKTADVSAGAPVVTDNWVGVQATGTDPYSVGASDSYGAYHGFFGSANISWNAYTQEVFSFPASKYDAAFTSLEAGKNYVYITTDYRGADYGGGNKITSSAGQGVLKGLKTVSITFAGTTGTSTYYSLNNGQEHLVKDGKPFDPATDYFQIGVGLVFGNTTILGLKSEQYKKNGEFYTYTYTIPTKDQLVASGLAAADADIVLKDPNFVISNESNMHDDSWGTAPILIQKVVFTY